MAQKAAFTFRARLLKRLEHRNGSTAKFTGWNKLLLRCRELAARLRRTFLAHTRVTQVVLPSVFFFWFLAFCYPLPQPPDTHSRREGNKSKQRGGREKGRGRCSSIIPPQRLTHPLASRLAHTLTRTHTYIRRDGEKKLLFFQLPCSLLQSRRKATPRRWSSLHRPDFVVLLWEGEEKNE